MFSRYELFMSTRSFYFQTAVTLDTALDTKKKKTHTFCHLDEHIMRPYDNVEQTSDETHRKSIDFYVQCFIFILHYSLLHNT